MPRVSPEQRKVLDAASIIFASGLAGPPKDPTAIILENDDDDGAGDGDDCSEWSHESEQDAFEDGLLD